MIPKPLCSAMFGLVAGIDGLGTSVAFAALIFSGALVTGFGAGVSVMLLSCVILAAFVSWRSRYPTSIAQVQETNIAILASAVTAATGSMAAGAQEKVATAFAILAVSTIGTGVLFYLFGRFRFGVLVRFLPYSVIAGFLAGSGWLLFDGALMMISNESRLFDILLSFGEPRVLGILVPSLIFAVVMAAGLRLSSSPLVTPTIMIFAVTLFYAVAWASGLSLETLRDWRWLPNLSGAGGLTLPSPLYIVSAADWHAVLGVLPMVISVPLVAMAGLLLNTSGLEVAAGQDIDANSELKVSGQANVMVGLFGGASGFTGLGMTLLAGRLGVTDRSAGIATALVMALALPFATELAASIPLFLAAGLMIMLGAELFNDWAVSSRKSLPPLEWAVVLAIVLSMMAFGFMTGMAVGLVFSIVTFVYSYAQLPVIRLAASGHDRRSSTDRSAAANHILDNNGHLIHVVELQGYLFFGTVEQVFSAIRRRLGHGSVPRFLILDFRNVSGTDSAAIAGFVKLFNMLSVEKVEVLLSPLSPDVQHVLERALETGPGSATIAIAADLDHALEECEDRILATHGSAREPEDIAHQLVRALGPHPRLPGLVSVMERMELAVGATLITAGEEANDIFVLGAGRVKVQVTLSNGRKLRLRSMTAGAVLGEVAFYLGGARTADVIIEEHATLFRLTRPTLNRLEAQDPALAALAHQLFAGALAERLTIANRMVQLASA